jgi:thioredoxin 1
MVKELDAANFDATINGENKLILVDLWAAWCGPCRRLSPIVDALAEEYAESIEVGKVNVDDNQDIAGRYGVQSIPTLLFFKNGKVVERSVGLRDKQDLAALIEKHK